MNFSAWTRALSVRGIHVVAPSHPSPIEVWAVCADGDVLHFRCRGTTVRLAAYSAGALTGIEVGQECGCGCTHSTPATGRIRTSVRPGATPHYEASYDGHIKRGWIAYEAGLLTVAEAAEIFEGLLAELRPDLAAAKTVAA